MAEEGLSPNSDWILVGKLSNDLIKLQTNFNNFVIEEKEKTVNLEKKNSFLENELKEMDKEIQKLKFEHKNEIEEMKQNLKQKDDKINFLEDENKKEIQKINVGHNNEIEEIKQKFQKLKTEYDVSSKQKDAKIKFLEEETNKKFQKINVDHKNEIKEMKKNIEQLKTENDQKNEKINLLEEDIRKEKHEKESGEFLTKNEIKIFKMIMNNANDLMDKKICHLIKANNSNLVEFVELDNKWSEIGGKCCGNNCINTDNPIATCIKGIGFVNIINWEKIKYVLGNEGCDNKYAFVFAENPFIKPQNCLDYSLFYFEIKCIFEGELDKVEKLMDIGVFSNILSKHIYYSSKNATIKKGESESFKIPRLSWNNNDIFGCGLVYPPTNKLNGFPYIFFTQNGKQIGKGILLDNFGSYKPFVVLECCSGETNFGNDLTTKPFKYDISQHLVLKEFY
uniref:SPRY domain-containing protein n=1 Tax=Meloidogyne incognita TaxID=6306 RepID=A0A914LYZ0_MELIC